MKKVGISYGAFDYTNGTFVELGVYTQTFKCLYVQNRENIT